MATLLLVKEVRERWVGSDFEKWNPSIINTNQSEPEVQCDEGIRLVCRHRGVVMRGSVAVVMRGL